MIFVIRTDDDVAGIDIVEALQIAGINHEIVSKQKHELSQNSAIAAAVAAERERCAFVCEENSRKYKNAQQEIAALQCAKAIRAVK